MTEFRVGRHPDFPLYDICSDGSVVSHVHSRPRTLKPIKCGKYLGFTLVDRNGRPRRVYLHRLVTEVFHGPQPDGQEARHLDGNKSNNSEGNLDWGTRSQNMQDKVLHGTAPQGERHGSAKLTDAAVIDMRNRSAVGASITDLTSIFGVSRMTCWRVVKRKLWTHI